MNLPLVHFDIPAVHSSLSPTIRLAHITGA